MSKFIPTIGLEVHIEQDTKSKMFCSCPADFFGKEPNTQVCPVCLGLPGALPYPNRQAIENTILFGLAFGCQIATLSKFDRKHYFYPDLPKGYQISQYDLPLCSSGDYKLTDKTIKIRRIHLEEDTAKSVHTTIKGKKASLLDFNRSGIPLMEMVTEPDFTSPEEVSQFLKEVQTIVRYLKISTADMEKGSMRLEANISLRPEGEDDLADYKVELKNINSFKFLEKALRSEIDRQKTILDEGNKVTQETRGYDESANTTFSQRTKEEEQDYRYFPEPDIAPIRVSADKVRELLNLMPELPSAKKSRYGREFGISEHFTDVLLSDNKRAEYFEAAVLLGEAHKLSPKDIAKAMVNQNMDKNFPESAGLVKKLIEIHDFDFADEQKTKVTVLSVLDDNPTAVSQFNEGKEQVVGFLIGQVQARLDGRGDPKLIQELVRRNLKS